MTEPGALSRVIDLAPIPADVGEAGWEAYQRAVSTARGYTAPTEAGVEAAMRLVYTAGRQAAAADIRAFYGVRERNAQDHPPASAAAFRQNAAVLGAYRTAAKIAEHRAQPVTDLTPVDRALATRGTNRP